MIRQSLGLGTIDFVRENMQEDRTKINSSLVQLLQTLIPHVSDSDIIRAVVKFVNKSLTIKKAMTEEQAFYRCYWVNGGDAFDLEIADAVGEEIGSVCMCTFPGLERIIKKDGVRSVILVVKACVVLQKI